MAQPVVKLSSLPGSPMILVFTVGWLGGSVVERRSLIGELSLVCTGPAADG